MPPIEFYKQRLISLQAGLAVLNKKKLVFGRLRLITIAAIILSLYFIMPYNIWYVVVATILLLALFIRLVLADLKNKTSIKHLELLININDDEINAITDNYYHFIDGQEHIPKNHLYANDLDIFGHASLFQLINRTGSEMGSSALADWLLNPAKPEIIIERQAAVKELSAKTKWRQDLQALGAVEKIQHNTVNRLKKWFTEDYCFIKTKFWLTTRYLIPLILFAVILLNLTDVINNYVRNYFLLAAALFAFYVSKKITPLHQQVSKMTGELEVLNRSIKLIEETNFTSVFLQDLQKQFIQYQHKASAQINLLKKILERLDLRFNFLVFIPLDILLQWDLQQAIDLEKWKEKNHSNVLQWFSVLGEFEAITSLSNLSFNHPSWCFPSLKEEHFFIEGKEIGHPLIKADKCVTNPVKVEHTGELMLVTGSNMAGKSTYLRSIGVNTVLAMAGAPVCAAYFCLSPVQIVSSMRITDNLEESTSTFYAELKKLKTIIDKVNNNEKVFILLDEILRGTNSFDRHTGSAALIKQLIKQHAACIIATHDVELSKMKEAYPTHILNYHFDVQISNDELYFDYRLKEGICTSLNASILMKKIGIEL
jgi:DNA mismatch repair ATPase MutS